MSKKSKVPTFERPAYSAELTSKESRQKYDELPGWQRHFIKRIVDHGNVKLAAQEAGVAKHAKGAIDYELTQNRSFIEDLEAAGIDNACLIGHIKDCLEAETIKFDKKGNPLKTKNHGVTIKTIEMLLKLKDIEEAKGKGNKSGSVIDLYEKEG
jgi:hypothetical protein